MSYIRFGWEGSQVYIYEHVNGYIECCGCFLGEKGEEEGRYFRRSQNFSTGAEAAKHIIDHLEAGHVVPEAWAVIEEVFNREQTKEIA